MKVRITFNTESDHDIDNADLLYQLGASIDEEDNNFYIDVKKLDDVFTLNEKLHKITNDYWFIIVGNFIEGKKIFIEKDIKL